MIIKEWIESVVYSYNFKFTAAGIHMDKFQKTSGCMKKASCKIMYLLLFYLFKIYKRSNSPVYNLCICVFIYIHIYVCEIHICVQV